MKTDDVIRELRHPGALELLRSRALMRLAYTGTDGFPRVIPIGFLWNGERIVVCTATTAPKVRALGLRPQVALTIDTGDTPASARSLLVRGNAELTTVDGIPDEYIAASAKALDAAEVPAFERAVGSMYKQMVRISIEPTWARYYDFGAGRIPAFLEELAGGSAP
jgi:nitroimidazol reductase NimA-like FMN-containing flavoprotein (pyridoxamine 5'-phosphate oxidase superfamily)